MNRHQVLTQLLIKYIMKNFVKNISFPRKFIIQKYVERDSQHNLKGKSFLKFQIMIDRPCHVRIKNKIEKIFQATNSKVKNFYIVKIQSILSHNQQEKVIDHYSHSIVPALNQSIRVHSYWSRLINQSRSRGSAQDMG